MYRFVVLLFLSTVHAQIQLTGYCNWTHLNYVPVFDPALALGSWHQILRIPNSIESGDCAQGTIEAVFSNTSLQGAGIYNSEVVNAKLQQRNGSIDFSTLGGNLLNITYSNGNWQNYAVLGISEDYLVLYSCMNIDALGSKNVTAWVYSRETTLSSTAAISVYALIAGNADINSTDWQVVSHTESACKYDVQAQSNGTCNFSNMNYTSGNLIKLYGSWHQTSRLPNSKESGECAQMIFLPVYADVTNTTVSAITVHNSEVVSGKLQERNATLAGTNLTNSGVLNITYNDGDSQNYVVLGIGDDYFVLYSCVDVSSNNKTVSAWVYSRNTTLSASATTAVKALIAGNADIASANWTNISHTEAACRSSGRVNLPFISTIILLLIGLALCKEI